MFFSGTYFYNFRNIAFEKREWSPGFNMICGSNGSGKTNFLEGLSLLSGWGPLDKNTKMLNLIRWSEKDGARQASLWGRIDGEEPAELFASLSSRCQLKRDSKIAGAAEMRGKIPLLAFLPSHMSLVNGSASYRRRLLDVAGALIYLEYARVLHDYRSVLRQKAVLLKKRRETKAAEKILVTLGSWLWGARSEIVKMLSSEMKNFASLLSAKADFTFVRGGGGLDENPSDDFRKSLSFMRDRETRSGIPLVGPQRDDLKIEYDGRPSSDALSRGQGRKLASALILALARIVENSLSRKPVLVFDEIYSELDAEGREYVTEALASSGCQIFASTTEASPRDRFDIFKIRDGRFLRNEAS